MSNALRQRKGAQDRWIMNDCGNNDDADDADDMNGVGKNKNTYNPFCREMKMS